MEEAESLRLIRNNQENHDWWFNTTNTTTTTVTAEAAAAVETASTTLFDTDLLLDTGIIDFESSPLFTAPPASTSPLLDNLIDFNSTSPLLDNLIDFSMNTTNPQETMSSSFDFNGPTSSPTSPTTTDLLDIGDWSWLKEDKILEPISSNALLSHNNYEEEEEEEESESEEDDFVVVLVNNIPPQDSKWISNIPRKRSLVELDHHDEPLASNKRIRI